MTGGSGRLAQTLKAATNKVAALPRSRLDVTDSSDIERELRSTRYSVVLNTAGVTSVEAAEAAPDLAREVNTVGPGLLAEICARLQIPYIHISTDYVFGAEMAKLWCENDPVSPVNVYGRSKAEGEARVTAAGGMAHIVRVAWLFGDEKDFIAGVLRLARHGSISVAQDQIGSPTPLEPLVERLLAMCRRLSEGDTSLPHILHLAGTPPASRADWVSEALTLLQQSGIDTPRLRRAPMDSFPSKVVRPHFSALDSALSTSIFGQSIDWRPHLAGCVESGLYTSILRGAVD